MPKWQVQYEQFTNFHAHNKIADDWYTHIGSADDALPYARHVHGW